MRWAGWLALAACLSVATVHAMPTRLPVEAAPTLQEGVRPRASTVLEDPDFGVRREALGLDRVVEMYQWRRQGDRYARVWNGALIDSSDFDAHHQNPPMTLQGERWWAPGPSLAGHPLDDAVLRELGEWRTFRPGFSRLPLNMAATFQPDGDGLGSADNPLQPQVGDLRIHWRELVLPPLHDRVVFREGRWVLATPAAGEPPVGDGAPSPGRSAGDDTPLIQTAGAEWWLLTGAVLLLALLLLIRRKP